MMTGELKVSKRTIHAEKHVRRFSDMFVRCPLYLSQGPCRETIRPPLRTSILDTGTHRSRDMIRCALAPHPHEHLQGRQLHTPLVPTTLLEVARERGKGLQPLRVRPDDYIRIGLRFWCRLRVVLHLPDSEACSWKVLSLRRRKAESFAGGRSNRVHHGVERQLPGECHRGYDRGRGEEVHREPIPVVARLEVAVEGRDDSYMRPLMIRSRIVHGWHGPHRSPRLVCPSVSIARYTAHTRSPAQ